MKISVRSNARNFATITLLVCSLSVLNGCGGDGTATPPETAVNGAAAPAQTSTAATPSSTPGTGSSVVPAKPNQKMLGDIPYDVWFDDPVGMVNSSQPIPTAAVNPTPETMDAGTSSTPADTTPRAETGGDDWATVIPAEILQAEVKAIRNFLNGKLQTVGQYNSNMFDIPARTASLAVMAGIADSHTGEIAWKERAAHIRTIAAGMHEEKLQTGPKFQRPLLEKFEQIDEMLSGSLPGGIEEPPAEFEFAELAELPFVMKRMEMAFNNMKTNAGSEDGFKENSEMVTHESAVLGALMKASLTEGHGYADDEEFLAFAKPIQDAATNIRDAVDLGNFEKYDSVLSAISKSCTQCHNIYKP